MDPLKRDARIAGFLYLIPLAPIRLVYIPRSLFVPGNAATTADNIAASETLFRVGILADLFAGVAIIFISLALYRLLSRVDRNYAALMVILGGLMIAPIYFVNTINDAGALLFASDAEFLSVFDEPQRDAMALLFLRLHHHGVLANEIFWGLWLFPFGILVYRSGFLPRFLGVWLIINSVAWLAVSFTSILLPRYEDAAFAVAMPAFLGELATMLWLVIKGAKEQPVRGVAH